MVGAGPHAGRTGSGQGILTYPVGQIVADMREETSVRQVVQDMLGELAEAKERLDRLLG